MKILFQGLISVRTVRGSSSSNDVLSDHQVGHGIPGADNAAQVVHLTPVQIGQIVSNAVSQTLTHQTQQVREVVCVCVCGVCFITLTDRAPTV